MIYLIGSLRNPKIPEIEKALESEGFDVFADWYSAGPEADDYWRDYERGKGHNLAQALAEPAAQHVYNFDRHYLERSDTVVLVMPAGKSAHLELGWALGQGKKGYILLEEDPDRYDVMYNFTYGVFFSLGELVKQLKIDRYSEDYDHKMRGLACIYCGCQFVSGMVSYGAGDGRGQKYACEKCYKETTGE